jgi:formiminotetrahydrofolate cyclodeaminase
VALLDLPLRDFVARLYSEDAEYGGGSVAALAGSLAAGLVVMVGRTILRGGGDADASLWEEVTREAERLSLDLLASVNEDTEAYEAVVVALRMPRAGEADRRARGVDLERALLQAASVPHRTVVACERLLGLADSVAGGARRSVLSDLGSAAHLALAGARAAALNVAVNAGCLPEVEEATVLIASCRGDLASAEALADSFARRLSARGADADGNWKGWLSVGESS